MVMDTTAQILESLIARVRDLPEERQQAVIDAIHEIADEPYRLSEDELSILRPALEEAKRGEYLVDAETDPVLNGSWK